MMKTFFIIFLLASLSSCRFFWDKKEIDHTPRLTSSSLFNYDLTLNLNDFKSRYSSTLSECSDDHVAPLGEGYYTTKYKFPIKTCHLEGNIIAEFTDIENSAYEIKQFKKDYTTAIFSLNATSEKIADMTGRHFSFSAPSDIRSNGDARLLGKQRYYKGVLYIFSKPGWEGKENRTLETAKLGRLLYVNDKLENKIQDKLREMRK